MSEPERPLHIPAAVVAALRLAWEEGRQAGREPCGYLVGEEGGEGTVVHDAPSGANVHPEPARAFALDPMEHLGVRRLARARGLRVLGCWHGHLRGTPRPSRADLEGLGPLGPGLMLIAGPGGDDPPRLRAWRRVGHPAPTSATNEVPIVVR